MSVMFTVVVMAFVVAVLAIVVFGLFEVTPFAHHAESYRDPRTGKRRCDSPHLD